MYHYDTICTVCILLMIAGFALLFQGLEKYHYSEYLYIIDSPDWEPVQPRNAKIRAFVGFVVVLCAVGVFMYTTTGPRP